LVAATGGWANGQRPAERRTVRISEHDFHIKAPKNVSAGDVTFEVHNKGPDAHELLVVRARKTLPMRADGLTADEDALHPLGTLEPGNTGSVRELHLHLAPGRYELLCNMSGHYLGGMHRVFVVH
jgi:uncharacterized cupredoxin-like copper-binding protein